MWSALVYLPVILVSSLFCAISAQRNCPSVDGRSQLRPYSRDYLMSLEYKQYDCEAKRITVPDQNCKPEFSCTNRKYRTADGSCNNVRNSRWGKSMECVHRLAQPVYADGSRAPKVAKSGRSLPNARIVSTTMHSDFNRFEDATHMLMQWGQFLDHDMTFTPAAQLRERVMNCCNGQSNNECFPITIPNNDPFYSQFNRRCMTFVRSAPCMTCTMYREQINALTAFIDASNVYGSMDNETRALRLLNGSGKLRTQRSRGGRDLLPASMDLENDQCSNSTLNKICFTAGDSRVNVLPSLTMLHTLFVREHNRLCDRLKSLNRNWDEETLFQEARRIVGAEMQMITYDEFLPVILGRDKMHEYQLFVGGRSQYNADVNPTIFSEFSTAAFRFGHTLIDGLFHTIPVNGQPRPYRLRENFFNPEPLHRDDIDVIIRGMIGTAAQRFDPFVTEDVTNHLYRMRTDRFGNDLIAFNIQRSRDHAIPGYTHYVSLCHKIKISSFQDLGQLMPAQQWQKYARLYESVDDIDIFSGMISEYQPQNAVVGKTMACIIAKQFHNLKFGDRYWFEHTGQSGSFSQAQLDQLRKISLSLIICLNADNFPQVHRRVMERDTGSSGPFPIERCQRIIQMTAFDLLPWRN